MNDLAELRRRLRAAPTDSLAAPNGEALARLAAVRRELSPPRGHRSPARIAKGILSFRMTPRDTPCPELKYACYGVARPMDWDGRILLAEPSLLEQLLGAVRMQPARRFRDCYRGLLTAWLDDVERRMTTEERDFLRAGITTLQAFLADLRGELRLVPRPPAWSRLISESGLAAAPALRALLGLEE